MKEIIFDFGANEGQNVRYFLDRAYYVVCVEANPILCDKIKNDFKSTVDSGRLFIENLAISNFEIQNELFYIHKKKHKVSQLIKPLNIKEFKKINVNVKKASDIIKKYLDQFNLEKVNYIKIDIEHLDHLVFKEIINSNINFKYISCEAHSSLVLKEVINSNLKFFKVIFGKEVKNLNYLDKNKKKVNFLHDSSGPFGEDIKKKWLNKSSLITYFVNHGFGWLDIHCSSLNEKNVSEELIYNQTLHNPPQIGFKYHIKRIFPEFVRSLKNLLRRFFLSK